MVLFIFTGYINPPVSRTGSRHQLARCNPSERNVRYSVEQGHVPLMLSQVGMRSTAIRASCHNSLTRVGQRGCAAVAVLLPTEIPTFVLDLMTV